MASNFLRNLFPIKQSNGSWWYSFGAGKYNPYKAIENLEAFQQVPELNAVINWKASAWRNAKINLVNIETGDIIKEDLDIFKFPNYHQGYGEFMRQTKLFHEIFGDEFIYLRSSSFSRNIPIEKIKSIVPIPPNLVTIHSGLKPFWQEKDYDDVYYRIKWNGMRHKIDLRDILHFNDNRVDVTGNKQNIENGEVYRGESKIQSLLAPVNNIKASYGTRGTNLKESGPRGILSNGTSDDMGVTIPLDPKEKKDIQEQLSGYGSQEGQNRHVITNQNLRWQPMSFPTAHLKAFEEVTEDHKRICDAFGLKIDIFSREKGSTYENQKQAEKEAYSNTILPEFREWIDGWNNKLVLPTGTKLTGSFSHLPIFSEDLSQTATATKNIVDALDKALVSGAITLEEYQEVLNRFLKLKK